jgi:hypothetical protein
VHFDTQVSFLFLKSTLNSVSFDTPKPNIMKRNVLSLYSAWPRKELPFLDQKTFFLLFSVLLHRNKYIPGVLSFKIKFSSKILETSQRWKRHYLYRIQLMFTWISWIISSLVKFSHKSWGKQCLKSFVCWNFYLTVGCSTSTYVVWTSVSWINS